MRPKGSRVNVEYKFLVITSVEGNSDPFAKRRASICPFYVGQIVVVYANGGMPLEVGSETKPGKIGCQSETYERLIDAVEKSCDLWGTGFGHRQEGEKQQGRPRRKKQRLFRHKA